MRNFPLKQKVLHLTFAAMIFTFSLSGTVFSQASTRTTNEFIPFLQGAFVPCANGGAGEFMLISGILHVQIHETSTKGRLITELHSQPQGVTGIGSVTGDVYHSVGVQQIVDSFPLSNGATAFTLITNLRLIGPGPDNNFQLHENVHFTINGNGQLTVEVDNHSLDCN